ncbi:hypothetical protein Despr_0003 [Desulfobulbus propionicus DSM 2032]|jgi:hypothetical protein|uniref:Uncharacterized protein n=1 Tax=Desulfobulbus propionicus (strain ATCC 33891 / DSM 2032 / VKM B-1956 / 1pr3) TaxID=577650 RepID=A0A7U4DMS5_DESPD|nr:hypothetical protein [Desulfobulbus propionicus]ADW16197.1 hypothetical protein Despr_0003 [Desulfobulbus propionicus DSM 2032]
MAPRRSPGPSKERQRRIAPLVVIGFFLLLLLIGIAVDEPTRVLEQARAICLGCIGIG